MIVTEQFRERVGDLLGTRPFECVVDERGLGDDGRNPDGDDRHADMRRIHRCPR